MPDRSILLTRDAGAVMDARAWLCEEIAPWTDLDPDTQGDVLVMASELVSNVLMHTTSVPFLVFGRRDGWVRIGVRDDDPAPPRVLPVDPHRVGGNGMRVVDAWADRWGVDVEPTGGKTVWFVVEAN